MSLAVMCKRITYTQGPIYRVIKYIRESVETTCQITDRHKDNFKLHFCIWHNLEIEQFFLEIYFIIWEHATMLFLFTYNSGILFWHVNFLSRNILLKLFRGFLFHANIGNFSFEGCWLTHSYITKQIKNVLGVLSVHIVEW